MPTAYSYIRFSSKKQEHGDSLNRQMEKTKEYCLKHSITLSDKTFKDLGISGYKDKTRASLDDMFVAIENGSIATDDYIILEALDRLSRQGIDKTMQLIRNILKAGVKIVILQSDLVLDKSSVDDLISVIRIAVAADIGHKESLQKSQRVQSAKSAQKTKAKKKEFIKKRTVFWLSKNENEDGYEFNDKKQIIELIIELRKQGDGFHNIAKHLNNKTSFKPRVAKNWADQTVRQIISSPILYGAYQIGTDKNGKFTPDPNSLVLDYFPALISFDEWKKLQPEFINRTGGNTKHNHLSGLVRCRECGGAMGKKISKRTTKTKTHHYKNWYCISNKFGACNQNLTVKDLDEVIFYLCKNIKVDKPKSEPKVNELQQEVYQLEERIRDVKSWLANPEIEFTTYASILDDLTNRVGLKRNELEKELNSSVEIESENIERLTLIQSDAVKFNLELKQVAKNIQVRFRSKKAFNVTMNLRNGYWLSLDVYRKSERSSYQYNFVGTDPSIKNPELFEWEDEFGSYETLIVDEELKIDPKTMLEDDDQLN
jgi:hypothetical protein